MRITWIGCHEEGVPAFKKVLEAQYKVDLFITLEEGQFTKRSAATREYLNVCKKHQIPCQLVQSIKFESAYQMIRGAAPDILIVLGWSEILPERLLAIPTIGTVGAHASLLPHNRGSAPVNWALIHGEKVTGNTLMWLNQEVDSGSIIDQKSIPITIYDTCKTIYDEVAKTNTEMIMKLLHQLDIGAKPIISRQNESSEALLPRRRPADGKIDWNQPAGKVYDFIRALTKPYPGAFSYLDHRKWTIWICAALPNYEHSKAPGTICGNVYCTKEECNGILIACENSMIIAYILEDEESNEYQGSELTELDLQGVFSDE